MAHAHTRAEDASTSRRVALDLAPFVAAVMLAGIVAPIGTKVDWVEYAGAAALAVTAGAVRLLPWRRRARRAVELILSLTFLGAATLLRDSVGGAVSGVAVMALLPVFWTALYGDRAQLCIVTLALAAFLFAPEVLIGGSAYPASQYRSAVLFLAVATIIGFTTQALVAKVRLQADEAERHEHELEEVAELMRRLSSTDELTGLPNRRAWETKLEQALAAAEPVVLAMLDLDHFKRFNDTRGHPAGDRLLKETAAAWRDELRGGDFLARIGGEEFALLVSHCAREDALAIVDRLRARIPYEQTCSAGVVALEPGESAEALMTRVDAALYDAKAAGRDCVSVAC